MTKSEMQQVVITTVVVSTVSAVASGLVSYAISKAIARYEESKLSEREKALAEREQAVKDAMAQLPFPLSGYPRRW